jgi:hypothetical protein
MCWCVDVVIVGFICICVGKVWGVLCDLVDLGILIDQNQHCTIQPYQHKHHHCTVEPVATPIPDRQGLGSRFRVCRFVRSRR